MKIIQTNIRKAVLIPLILGVVACGAQPEDEMVAEKVYTVSTATIGTGDTVRHEIKKTAYLRSDTEASVRAETGGTVSELLFAVGDTVTAGQTLLKIGGDQSSSDKLVSLNEALDNQRASALASAEQVAAARLNVASAEEQLAQANLDLANTVEQHAKELNTLDVQTSTALINQENTDVISDRDIESAESSLRVAEVALDLADSSLDNTKISNTQNLQNGYDSVLTEYNGVIATVGETLTTFSDIFVVQERLMADGDILLRDEYGYLVPQTKIDVVARYRDLRERHADLGQRIVILSSSQYSEIDALDDEIAGLIKESRLLLTEAKHLLNGTVPTINIPQDAINTLIARVDGQKTSLQIVERTLEAVIQGLASIKVANTSALDAARLSLASAKASLESAESNYYKLVAAAKSNQDNAGLQVDSVDSQLQATKARQVAEISAVESRVRLAEISLENAKNSLEQTLVNQQASADSQRARVALAQSNVDRLTIKSPFTGQVASRSVERGDTIAAGATVATVITGEGLKVTLNLTSSEIQNVTYDIPVAITTELQRDIQYTGQVVSIAPSADPITKTYEVEIAVEDPDSQLLAGQNVDVVILIDVAEDSFYVPLEAVIVRSDGGLIWAVQDGRAVARQVQLGRSSSDQIEVISGLNEGEVIVVSGARQLSEGDQLRINGQ